MEKADQLLAAGDVVGARQELIEQVRANPGSVPVRMFLFQLCAMLGEWDRAKAQLETIAKLEPEARMLAVAYSQCIDAEALRGRVFSGAEAAPMLARTDWGEALAAGLQARQLGQPGAAEQLAAAFDQAPTTSGVTDSGLAFEWIADADPRLGPVTEAIIAGRYGLMPFEALELLTIHEPQDLRDTIWIPAEFGLRQGARIAGFIPVRYPGSEGAEDPSARRGMATDWVGAEGAETPMGQRLFVFSDGSEVPLLQLRRVEFGEV